MENVLTILFAVGLAIFGLLVGSFLNVCIFRIPKKIFFSAERSFCPKCGHTLRWYELVPLFSYIGLGAKCRDCKAKISVRYPMVELLNMLMYIACFFAFGTSVWTVVCCVAISTLIVISGIDLDIKEIPNGSVLFIMLIALVGFIPEVQPNIIWWEKLIGLVVISVPFFIIAFITNGGIGGGDIKLMAACGLLLGWKNTLVATLLAIVAAGLAGVGLLLAKRAGRKFEMPLGPFLAVGVVVAMFFGESIISMYTGLFA